MRISKALPFLLSLAVIIGLSSPASASGGEFRVSLPGVSLRPGVTSTINATIYETGHHPCWGGTVLAIHGFAHTGETWRPFADALFTDPFTRFFTCRVVAIDLPGHGRSSLPAGVSYGDLTLDDYVTGALASLDALKAKGIRPRSIIGHSMGGLILQMMQERLITQGKTLRSRYGIISAVGLSPSTPAPAAWTFADSGTAVQILGPMVAIDDLRGATFAMETDTWIGIFFTNRSGELAPGAPTAEEVDALGWNVPESLVAGLHLVGAAPMPSRPFVREGAFAPSKRTMFTLIHLGEDAFSLESEDFAVYQHLTGDPSGALFMTVDDPEAVHNVHISNPHLLIDSITEQLF